MALEAGLAQAASAMTRVEAPNWRLLTAAEEPGATTITLAEASEPTQVAQGPMTPPTGAPSTVAPQTPTPAEAAAAATPDDEPDPAGDVLRLQVLQARAELGLGNVNKARTTAEGVLAQRPDDLGALRVIAAAEETSNRWRYAAQTWDRVATLGNDAAAARRRDDLIAAHPSHITGGAFFEGSLDGDTQYGLRATAAWRPLDGPEWDGLLEQRHAEDDQALAFGNVTPGSVSEDVQRLEVGVTDTLRVGRVSGRVIATSQDVGARAGYGRDFASGAVDVTVGLNEPYWLFSEAVAAEATIDYVQLSGAYRWDRVSARASVRQGNIGVAGDEDMAETTRVTVGVDGRVTDERNPFIVSYILDDETYDPQPGAVNNVLGDRTVHSLGVYKALGDTNGNFVNLGAGYRSDTDNDADGPFGSIWAEREIADRVTLGLRAEYSSASVRGEAGDDYSFAEVYVRRRF